MEQSLEGSASINPPAWRFLVELLTKETVFLPKKLMSERHEALEKDMREAALRPEGKMGSAWSSARYARRQQPDK